MSRTGSFDVDKICKTLPDSSERFGPNALPVNSDGSVRGADRYRKRALTARRGLTDEQRIQKSEKIAREVYALIKELCAGADHFCAAGAASPPGLSDGSESGDTDGILEASKSVSPDILCFYPLFDEVDLRGLYARLLVEGARLFFPVTEKDTIRFFRVSSMDQFCEGAFHVFEPIERACMFDDDAAHKSYGSTALGAARTSYKSTASDDTGTPDDTMMAGTDITSQTFHYIAITPGVAFDTTGSRIGFGRGYYDRFFAAYPNGFRIGVAFAEQVFDTLPTNDTDVPMHRLITA
ncbi:MAG: hypothetical protein IJT32_01620 [Lachnospiraceae bacterium]|nr:hypothetical protein [Lachnospiraceae bacterium]